MTIAETIHFLYGASFWGSFMAFRDNAFYLFIVPSLMMVFCFTWYYFCPENDDSFLLIPCCVAVASFGISFFITFFQIMAVCIRLFSGSPESYINDIKSKGDIVTCYRCVTHFPSNSNDSTGNDLDPVIIHADSGDKTPMQTLKNPSNKYRILKGECDMKHKYYARSCRIFLKKEGTELIFSFDLGWFLQLYQQGNEENPNKVRVQEQQRLFEK